MSIAQAQKIAHLERRVTELEARVVQQSEQLAQLMARPKPGRPAKDANGKEPATSSD